MSKFTSIPIPINFFRNVMAFEISIPTSSGELPIQIEIGSSVVIVGANGGGKTRLAVHIENTLKLNAHRISAHRALTLNPAVPKISESVAIRGLRTGYVRGEENVDHRIGQRWGSNMAVSMLNDFDFLVQALFADQSNVSLRTHVQVRAGDMSPADLTKFEKLDAIWKRLLPHRELIFSGDDIQVEVPGSNAPYKAADMSDGERAIFYLIGQTLAAAENTLLIFDEPELHIHRSIMSKLWDELEVARPDCAFLFITHDLEFAATRVAQKFVISDFNPTPQWTIKNLPESTGFDEEIATLILGSRRPILFVEGNQNSLDSAIFRCCYPDWTVIPRGSCEQVIHSVVTMRRNSELTRVTCSGIVDADHYDASDIAYFNGLGVAVLPVSEIENMVLLPEVSRAIALLDGYQGAELETCLDELRRDIFETLNSSEHIDAVVTRHCRRRIDSALKKIDLSDATSISDIAVEYRKQTEALDIAAIAAQATTRIKDAVEQESLSLLLMNYDNKGLMALAAKHLKRAKRADFESWLTRVVRNNVAPDLVAILQSLLPKVSAK